ncbi:hypothetical protein BDV96DRAFT_100878 [Lophiotrema nucula]|uniref:C3H1-type domain-containing protein n=1 Tax=Lophiotrema nucula TaxID=690887 RepID=A0A6A5Z4Y2_9PLEO|nr:hypothetical protein BDV96DRAFT_100878 [Lophiotrema nucula]
MSLATTSLRQQHLSSLRQHHQSRKHHCQQPLRTASSRQHGATAAVHDARDAIEGGEASSTGREDLCRRLFAPRSLSRQLGRVLTDYAVRKNINNGLLKILHAKDNKGYMRAKTGDEGVELMLPPDKVLVTHAAAVAAATESYVRAMTLGKGDGKSFPSLPTPNSSPVRNDNECRPTWQLEGRGAPTLITPMAQKRISNSSEKGMPSTAFVYHFHYPMGAVTFKLYDKVVQPDGRGVELYSGWYAMVQNLIAAWEQGRLDSPSSPFKPWTAGTYPQDIIIAMSSRARKVDPTLYGGSEFEDLLLCWVTFCATGLCPLGRLCCFRHDPLSADEIRWMLVKKGKDFLEVYMLNYTAGGLPEMTGIPILPPPAPVKPPTGSCAQMFPTIAPSPFPSAMPVNTTPKGPMTTTMGTQNGNAVPLPTISTGRAITPATPISVTPMTKMMMGANGNVGLPSSAVSPTVVAAPATPDSAVYRTTMESKKQEPFPSTASSATLVAAPTAPTLSAPMMVLPACKDNGVSFPSPTSLPTPVAAPTTPTPVAQTTVTSIGTDDGVAFPSPAGPFTPIKKQKVEAPMTPETSSPPPSPPFRYPSPSNATSAPSPYKNGFNWIQPKPDNPSETTYVSTYSTPVIDPQLQDDFQGFGVLKPCKKIKSGKSEEAMSSGASVLPKKRGRGRPRKYECLD